MELSPFPLTTLKSSSNAQLTAVPGGGGPMQAWWEGITKARERIQALNEVLGPLPSLEVLHESDRPAKGLMEDEHVAHAILMRLTDHSSGHGEDALCQWLYDTFQTGDADLQAVVIRYIPALCGLYLPRVTSHSEESLSGFEAVLLALYAAETKARNGCSMVVNIPDLSQPSLYHTPRVPSVSLPEPRLGQLSAPLEPQDAVKTTKRACIVGVALDMFFRRVAVMPQRAKIEACGCAQRFARLSCVDNGTFADVDDYDDEGSPAVYGEGVVDPNVQLGYSSSFGPMPEIEIVGPEELFLGSKSPSHHMSSQDQPPQNGADFSPKRFSLIKHTTTGSPLAGKHSQLMLRPHSNGASVDFASYLMRAGNGVRVPLSVELVQPILRIVGHCLLSPVKTSEEVKQAAALAVKALHRRAFHDLMPEAMLATRSLMRLETASKVMSKAHSASGNSTSSSSKPRKPEILLVSR